MALGKRPHSLTTYLPTEPVAGQTPVLAAGVTVWGQLTPERSRAVFERNTGAELAQPHLFLFNLEDRTKLAYDAKCVDGLGRKFRVVSDVDVYNAGNRADCCACYLEETGFDI